MKLDDTSHIVIQHFFLYPCLDPLCGYDCFLQAGKEHRLSTAIPLTSFICWFLHFIVKVQNQSAWHAALGIYFKQTHLYFSGLTVPQTGTASLKFHSKQKHPCQHALSLAHGSSPGKGTLRQFLKSQ